MRESSLCPAEYDKKRDAPLDKHCVWVNRKFQHTFVPTDAKEAIMAQVAFGVFDWIDRGKAPLRQLYEERLQLLEVADAAGFFCYHLAEHHATPLGMAPSPAQRNAPGGSAWDRSSTCCRSTIPCG